MATMLFQRSGRDKCILLLSIHSEGHDRTDIGLPGNQDKLLQAIKGAISKTTPMIVVLMSGGPVDITTAKVELHMNFE